MIIYNHSCVGGGSNFNSANSIQQINRPKARTYPKKSSPLPLPYLKSSGFSRRFVRRALSRVDEYKEPRGEQESGMRAINPSPSILPCPKKLKPNLTSESYRIDRTNHLSQTASLDEEQPSLSSRIPSQ